MEARQQRGSANNHEHDRMTRSENKDRPCREFRRHVLRFGIARKDLARFQIDFTARLFCINWSPKYFSRPILNRPMLFLVTEVTSDL